MFVCSLLIGYRQQQHSRTIFNVVGPEINRLNYVAADNKSKKVNLQQQNNQNTLRGHEQAETMKILSKCGKQIDIQPNEKKVM